MLHMAPNNNFIYTYAFFPKQICYIYKVMAFNGRYMLSTIQQRIVLTPLLWVSERPNRGPRLFISGNCCELRLKMSCERASTTTVKKFLWSESGAKLVQEKETCLCYCDHCIRNGSS